MLFELESLFFCLKNAVQTQKMVTRQYLHVSKKENKNFAVATNDR